MFPQQVSSTNCKFSLSHREKGKSQINTGEAGRGPRSRGSRGSSLTKSASDGRSRSVGLHSTRETSMQPRSFAVCALRTRPASQIVHHDVREQEGGTEGVRVAQGSPAEVKINDGPFSSTPARRRPKSAWMQSGAVTILPIGHLD